MFTATFHLVSRVGLYELLGISVDGSLFDSSFDLSLKKPVSRCRQHFIKKLKISCGSDHLILFKFRQHVVQILFEKCMEILWTSNVSISKTEEF